ncbi:MAG TPA: tripartite tricarboxylate transporter substrate-binding protein [Xanthobacteraceae bacterium]|nr:tripartite tricarboxylate transporter substrate-binding protein [Xanthobacteraceae bacterium]
MRKRLLLSLIALTAIHGAAVAQDWPAKQPVRVIVTNTPGSALDITARVVFEQVSHQIGQTVVVENRAGAANTIGIAAVAKAEPDGYTILVTTSAIAIAPYTHKDLPYDTLRDLAAVIPLGNLTNVMLTPAGRFKSISDLVAAAKAKPDALSYASIGPGSTGHLSAERLAISAGFKALHVPFKGSPEAVRDLAAGRLDFFFTPVVPALGLIREKKVDALAVSSSSRSSLLPDVPTTVQAGYADSDYNFWIGAFMPAATPQPILARVFDETRKALENPDIKKRLTALGAEPMTMSRDQFRAFLVKELELNAKLVKAANISAE